MIYTGNKCIFVCSHGASAHDAPLTPAPPDIPTADTVSFTPAHPKCKSSKSTFETSVETGKSRLGNDPVDDYI